MITENTMFWILLFFAMGICPSDAWICGNTGQCRCTSSGEVICTQITAAPYFTADYRLGRRLTIKTSPGFDTVSLADTIGFERVMVIGLSIEQCASAMLCFLLFLFHYWCTLCLFAINDYMYCPSLFTSCSVCFFFAFFHI